MAANDQLIDGLMDPVTCERAQLSMEEAAPQLVRDVMLTTPKTLAGNATLADARRFFENPKLVTAVLLDGARFAGILNRGDLPALVPESAPVRGYARRQVPTITPDRPTTEAIAILDATRSARLVVLEQDGTTFAGLLCLDLQRAGFCRG